MTNTARTQPEREASAVICNNRNRLSERMTDTRGHHP